MKRLTHRFFVVASLLVAIFASCNPPLGPSGGLPESRAVSSSSIGFPQGVGRLTGVNWFGFETASYAPHGLWSRDYKSMLKQIWDLGFNCVRLPYCDAMLSGKPNGIQINKEGVDAYTKIRGMNTDLEGLTSIQVLDKIVAECDRIGLKIILDNHSRKPDGYMNETLWYTDTVSEEQWIAIWVTLVTRYKNNPSVVAADLDNEPHGNNGQGMKPPAAWGYDMPGYPHTDWKKAAEKAGQAIVAANPKMIIVVEGVEEYKGETYWWGGNLQGVKDAPIMGIPKDNIVYSSHEYGPEVYNQLWFSAPNFPANMPAIWDKNFWFIQKQNIAPLFFGEFGIKEASAADPSSVPYKWLKSFMEYAGKDSSWTFWAMNPNSGDTGGILSDDWVTVNPAKYGLIKAYLEPQTKDIDQNAKAITSFSFANPVASGLINEAQGTISLTVPFGTPKTSLVASFSSTGDKVTVAGQVQTSGQTAHDFSQAVLYTVTALNGTTKVYTVSVQEVASSAKDILSFALIAPATNGQIDQVAKTIKVEVPEGTALGALVANFTTNGLGVKVGSVNQVSGQTPNNFTSPVTYRVTAQDGSYADYQVTVTVKKVNPVSIGLAYVANPSASSSNTLGMTLRVSNPGVNPIDLSKITLRYYYTKDGTPGQNYSVDYAGGNLGPGNYAQITSSILGVFKPAVATTADTYLELSFAASAPTLAPGGSFDIQLRIFNSSWANYNQANDYSFSAINASADYQKIPVFNAGVLINGLLP